MEAIIAGAVVFITLGIVLFRLIRNIRKGKTGCGCGCGGSSGRP